MFQTFELGCSAILPIAHLCFWPLTPFTDWVWLLLQFPTTGSTIIAMVVRASMMIWPGWQCLTRALYVSMPAAMRICLHVCHSRPTMFVKWLQVCPIWLTITAIHTLELAPHPSPAIKPVWPLSNSFVTLSFAKRLSSLVCLANCQLSSHLTECWINVRSLKYLLWK